MIALVCDRCGAVLRGKAEVENTTKLSMSTGKVGTYETKHLCEDCLDAFDLFLQEGGSDANGTR